MIFECPGCKFTINTDEQFIFDVVEVVTLTCKNCGSVLHGVAECSPKTPLTGPSGISKVFRGGAKARAWI